MPADQLCITMLAKALCFSCPWSFLWPLIFNTLSEMNSHSTQVSESTRQRPVKWVSSETLVTPSLLLSHAWTYLLRERHMISTFKNMNAKEMAILIICLISTERKRTFGHAKGHENSWTKGHLGVIATFPGSAFCSSWCHDQGGRESNHFTPS